MGRMHGSVVRSDRECVDTYLDLPSNSLCKFQILRFIPKTTMGLTLDIAPRPRPCFVEVLSYDQFITRPIRLAITRPSGQSAQPPKWIPGAPREFGPACANLDWATAGITHKFKFTTRNLC